MTPQDALYDVLKTKSISIIASLSQKLNGTLKYTHSLLTENNLVFSTF